MAVDVFEIWYPEMGRNEGGYINHPNDPGGATNKGITLDTFASLAPSVLGIDGTLENLKLLTNAQHKLIAKAFWNNLGDSGISTYRIRNWGIQYQAIEQFWGSGGANMFPLQRAANRFLSQRISVDGKFGNQTLTALNDVTNQNALFHAVYEERLNFYDAIIVRNAKLNSFRNGWQKRLMQGYLTCCKINGYQPIAELYNRLIRWNSSGPAVLSFDKAVPGITKLNGEPFNDKGFAGASASPSLALNDQSSAKTDTVSFQSEDEKKKSRLIQIGIVGGLLMIAGGLGWRYRRQIRNLITQKK